MKQKFMLGLALVLSSALIGCFANDTYAQDFTAGTLSSTDREWAQARVATIALHLYNDFHAEYSELDRILIPDTFNMRPRGDRAISSGRER